MKKTLLSLAAFSLAGTSIAASAADVSRESVPVEESSSMGGASAILTALLAAAAVAASITILTGDNNEDRPVSP